MTKKRLVKENKRENVARFSGGVIIKTTIYPNNREASCSFY
jgi:hypothetical protein